LNDRKVNAKELGQFHRLIWDFGSASCASSPQNELRFVAKYVRDTPLVQAEQARGDSIRGTRIFFFDEWRGAAMPARCAHLNFVKTDAPNTEGCEECLAAGDTWVHLRLCRACGHVGCCDDSKNKHATKHFKKTGHPIITSLEPGESWSWCYVDELDMELE